MLLRPSHAGLVILLLGAVAAQAAPEAPRPNFIVIYIDDMGYGDIGPFGSTINRTPNLDRMAAEGIRLTSFYAAPLCTPSRAALMTGCYPKRVGLERGSWHAVLMPGDVHGINPNERTLAEVLEDAGYATGCIGKWHLGDQPEFLPTRNGFDFYFGLPYSNDMNPDYQGRYSFPPLPLMRDGEVLRAVQDQSELTQMYTAEALRFIRMHKDKPFFLYLPQAMVHQPLAASKKFRAASTNGIFGAAVEELDWSTGQILDTLRELGLDKHTLVIFTSDNGPAAGSAGPLRGRKGSTYEGGMRVPAIAWWPGRIPAGASTDAMASVMDVLPTFAALAGAPLPDNKIDGMDIAPLLFSAAERSPHEVLFYYGGPSLRGVRSGSWKLYLAGGKASAPMLYNLAEDIGETTDVAAAHPEVVSRLDDYLASARTTIGDGADIPGVEVRPVGYHENPKFLIPRPGKTGAEAEKPVNESLVDKKIPGLGKPPRANGAQRPNFVIIFADDLGYNDLGCFGSPSIKTPRIDQMAAEGMKFTNCYAQPICGPSRAALMTGCYPMRVAERDNEKNTHPVLHSEEVTIAEVLKPLGYATAMLGKWDLAGHSNTDYAQDLLPQGQGFDSHFGTPSSNDSDKATVLLRNGEVIEKPANQDTLTRRYGDEAAEFIKKNSGQPFFLYLATNMPHTALHASDDFRGTSARGLYGDTVEEIDYNVGRVLDTIKDEGLAGITYVLFTSDNGPWLIKNKDWEQGALPEDHGGSAVPLRSGKVSTWEGGLRVPAIWWAPGRIMPESVCEKLTSTLDVMPTISALSGGQLPQDRVIDGENIQYLLNGRFDFAPPDKYFCYYLYTNLQAIRQGQWKLKLPRPAVLPWLERFSPNRHIAPADDGAIETPLLYNLEADPGETVNVAAAYPEVTASILELAETVRDDLGDYNRIGKNQRFFDPGPKRASEKKWIQAAENEALGLGRTQADAPRANIILIFADDQGYNDLGVFGSEKIRTPNIDRLAREGMRFTSFYAQAVCGPSRAALMSGCYPIRVAEPGNKKNQHTILHPREVTMAEVLRASGYATACIGKWHQGEQVDGKWNPETMPNAQGFEYFYGTPLYNGFTVKVDDNKFRSSILRNGETVVESVENWDHITQDYTNETIQFIREHKDGPFFIYLAHNMPHIPLGASEDFKGKSAYGPYGDAIEELDWSTGRIVETLRELGLEENTLLIYTSDNGPWIETTRGMEPDGKPLIPRDNSGTAAPLWGYKMLTWEGGLRVPCVMWWPGKIPAGTVTNAMAATIDLMPTFAGLAGAALPKGRTLDGKDIWPLMAGQPGAASPHDVLLYYCYTNLQALRDARWKLVFPRPEHPPWTGWSGRFHGNGVLRTELYDLDNDIAEARDVAAEHPEVVARLEGLAEAARADLGDYGRVGAGARFFDAGPRRSEVAALEAKRAKEAAGYPDEFTYTPALPWEAGVTRRDPSDVLFANNTYYVWYSKVVDGPGIFMYPSGYSADVYYASSPDGKTWTEQGLAVGKGGPGEWDEHGVFTPNILAADSKYYLFYTGVPKPFDTETKTAIGVAVADDPGGPWRKVDTNPVLRPSEDPADFDSMRVDDAALLKRDGKYWFYYKGRQLAHSPGETKMGVAVADAPAGPYTKYAAGWLHPGHEVMVWPQDGGVSSMAISAGPRMIYHADDGIFFEQRQPVPTPPKAPGCFRPDNFENNAQGGRLSWGICQAGQVGDVYLARFDCKYATPEAVSDDIGPMTLRFDFESGELGGWRVVEGTFGMVVSARSSLPRWVNKPFARQGKYHLSTIETEEGADDGLMGIIESPRFVLKGDAVTFLVGGGDGAETYVALCDADGKILLRAGGGNAPVMHRVRWDTTAYKGQELFLRVVDQRTRGWAHITFDDFRADADLVK